LKRFRFRKRIPLIATLAGLLAAAALYVLGLAFLQSRLYAYYDFRDLVLPRLVDATIVFWLLYFCGAIGSFLNVVAWRMPRGEAIGGRSRCPRCQHTLRTRDNVPVLGWIALRGRCHHCHLPISRRYPLVEALVAISLTLVGVSQLYSLALPGQRAHGHTGPIWAPHVTPTVLAILTYHIVAVSTSWAMALIRVDGERLPRSLIVFAAVAVIVPMQLFPVLMVVPWQTDRPLGWDPRGLYFDAVMRIITALVTAAFVGRVLAKGLCPTADLKLDPLGRGTSRLVDLVAMLAIPSLLIGWQSMPGFVIAASLLTIALRPLIDWIPINEVPAKQSEERRRRGVLEYFAVTLPIVLVLHLMFWRFLWNAPFWPSDNSDRVVIIVAALAVLAIPLWLKNRPSADELPQQHGEAESDHGNHDGDDAPGA